MALVYDDLVYDHIITITDDVTKITRNSIFITLQLCVLSGTALKAEFS